ncbi:hypothetical protein [Streptomyces sp. AS58]|uniref:hypothetical protein n=1 Tax=Streptomyces sp. AS58 TaxID=1519489 RepID=UPI000AE3C24C
MGTTKRLWRWRSNPLRRREDVVEAWVVLTVRVIVAVAGAVAGLVTARSAEHGSRSSAPTGTPFERSLSPRRHTA